MSKITTKTVFNTFWNANDFVVDGKTILTITKDNRYYRYRFDDYYNGSMHAEYFDLSEVQQRVEEVYPFWLKTQEPGYVRMTNRYKCIIDEYYDGIECCDRVWIDRKTGEEVIRYDLGDPANYVAEYGGSSDSEKFWRRGLDIDERIPESEVKE